MPAKRTCECMTCRKCHTREWARNRYRQRAYGQWSPHGDLDAVMAHIADLRANGGTLEALARLADVQRKTVQTIAAGKSGRITREVADKILAVKSAEGDTFPGFRVQRRLRALNAMGWTTRQLADFCDMTQEAVWDVIAGKRGYVVRSTFERIDSVYQRLCMTPGGNSFSVASARRHGYPPPLAWDDIDDPDEEPQGWHYAPIDRLEVVRSAVQDGLTHVEVCEALEINRIALREWCRRKGLSAEYRALTTDLKTNQHVERVA